MQKRLCNFLVLDFLRPNVLFNLLNSLRENVKIDRSNYRITVLANGGGKNYQKQVYDMYFAGYCDDLILHSENTGGGAHEQLHTYSREDYNFHLQSDHLLIREINEETINYFIELLKDYKVVDLAGNQGMGQYSERGNFTSREFYTSLSPLPGHSPGPYFQHGDLNNEGFLQKKFKDNNWKIAHITPLFFQDTGRDSIREHPCGGITLWRTDTKALSIVNPLKQKYDYLNISDDDWGLILNGKWENGTIPKNWLKDSFKCFPD